MHLFRCVYYNTSFILNKNNAMKHNQEERRSGALNRLEAQLENGTKSTKVNDMPLSDKDIKRISKEIEILKKRLL